MELTNKDLELLKSKEISEEKIAEQIEQFKQGFPFLRIDRPAVLHDGIFKLDDKESEAYEKAYEQYMSTHKIIKFVPASGAASRMFKSLLSFYNEDKWNEEVEEFFKNIHDFPFYDELSRVMKVAGDNLHACIQQKEYKKVLGALLNDMGYAQLPKGLLLFHKYAEEVRTPFEEHLVEGVQYARSGNQVYLHFTVSPEHVKKFKLLLETIQSRYEEQFDIKFTVDFSVQKSSTDTIAVNKDNSLFRNTDGSLLFRPGGHGALLENLNELDADLIFIKNIDNVVPDRLKAPTITYKKVLAGFLIDIQHKVFDIIKELEQGKGDLDVAIKFIEKYLGFKSQNWTKELVLKTLKRPLRVCGMVKNTGEPGGGPFWVKDTDGSESLQVAESAQVDLSDPSQSALFKGSTHFNPVDLICTTKDEKGKKYNLLSFRDANTGFISLKSKDGKDLKALELPGLWNGAMAFWNTLFVEVPIETFNPVKTVNDLLREQHQG